MARPDPDRGRHRGLRASLGSTDEYQNHSFLAIEIPLPYRLRGASRGAVTALVRV
jgi:hypothetical protein